MAPSLDGLEAEFAAAVDPFVDVSSVSLFRDVFQRAARMHHDDSLVPMSLVAVLDFHKTLGNVIRTTCAVNGADADQFV